MRKHFFATITPFVALLLPAVLLAYTSPGKPAGFVNDFAGVIAASEKQGIESTLTALKSSSGFEVAVVTIPSLGDETIETYAVKLFEEWGIGNKEKDTGILLLVAPNDRQVRIETGYGAEGAVTDIQSSHIIDDVMIPSFKEGKYGIGISDGVDAIVSIVTGSPEAAQYSQTPSSGKPSWFKLNLNIILLVLAFGLEFITRLLGATKSWWLGGVIGVLAGVAVGFIMGTLVSGIIAAIILGLLGLLLDFLVSRHGPGGRGGTGGFWPFFFGGGSNGFGSSGGFGGFGGGSSGGGGASGRW